jgi:hypothetical protein
MENKILLVVNYKEEIDFSRFSKFDFVDLKILNENK